MMANAMPTGTFTCEFSPRILRAPQFVREEKGGITYLIGRDYEVVYEMTLHFTSGAELPVTINLVGELNQQVVIRDAHGKPARISGYVQGRMALHDAQGRLLFRGRYYDARVVQSLAGDEALTPTGQRVVEHWQNGFGEGPYAGHAFSMGAQITRDGNAPPRGQGRGQID
jgi:hypothetical protein